MDGIKGLPPWLSRWRSRVWCRRHRFNPWVGKIPWRRKWLPTPVFLPEKSHGQGSLEGYSLKGHKESNMAEWLSMHAQTVYQEVNLWGYQPSGRNPERCLDCWIQFHSVQGRIVCKYVWMCTFLREVCSSPSGFPAGFWTFETRSGLGVVLGQTP